MRRMLATLLISFGIFIGFVAGPAMAENSVVFHFYGAKDCPPCMAFKRSGLPEVETAAQEAGFTVAVNVIDKTRDVPNLGSFGDTDPILREAAEQMDVVYPPIFFVTRNSAIISIHDDDWEEALATALQESNRSGS